MKFYWHLNSLILLRTLSGSTRYKESKQKSSTNFRVSTIAIVGAMSFFSSRVLIISNTFNTSGYPINVIIITLLIVAF